MEFSGKDKFDQRHSDDIRLARLDSDLCMVCHAFGAEKFNVAIQASRDISSKIPVAVKLVDTVVMMDADTSAAYSARQNALRGGNA